MRGLSRVLRQDSPFFATHIHRELYFYCTNMFKNQEWWFCVMSSSFLLLVLSAAIRTKEKPGFP